MTSVMTRNEATLALLNAARVEGGFSELPDINENTIKNIASILPIERLNEFLGVIVKISRQESYTVVFGRGENQFSRFFKAPLPAGWTTEHLFVEVIKGSVPAWNDDGTVALSRVKPSVKAQYTEMNFEVQYKISVSLDQIRSAFTSVEGAGLLINQIYTTLNTAYEWDLQLKGYELLSKVINEKYVKPVYTQANKSTEAGLKVLIETINNLHAKMRMRITADNKMGVLNRANEVVVFMNASTYNSMRINLLASVYNLEEMRMSGDLIILPDEIGYGPLANNDQIFAIVADARLFYITNQLDGVGSSIINPASLVTNQFRTARWSFSALGFANAYVITSAAPVNELTVANEGDANVTMQNASGDTVEGGSEVAPYEVIKAAIKPNGQAIESVVLKYTGEADGYDVVLTPDSDGAYTFEMPFHAATLTVNYSA